ncbi:MAG: glycosyl hydrolase family 18 [Blautia sp.]|nr:glycosyl hydrolase family 18 [Blautia sp.]
MRKKTAKPLIVVLLVILLAVVGLATHFVYKYMPSSTRMDLTEYYGEVPEGELLLIVDGEPLEDRGRLEGGTVYLPIGIVNEKLNERFYWDAPASRILYATPTEVQETAADVTPGSEVWVSGDQVFVSLPFVQAHTDLDTFLYDSPGRLAIRTAFSDQTVVTARRNAAVRYRGGIKSEILKEAEVDENMVLLEEYEDWYQVSTMDGYIGFVAKNDVSEPVEYTEERDFHEEDYQYLLMDEKINLVWHQVTIREANATLDEMTAAMSGVNVISPTWYSISDNDGNILDLSSADYVAKAHEKGLKVWGLIDNFSQFISTYEILSNTEARRNLITQLVNSAVAVGLDGINIDFESLIEDSARPFLQFLRELSIETHKNGLILSVDNPVPEDFTSHYNRKEQGKVVDYVIIMGYDEHYAGSEGAGSVASLPWVEKGIQDTLEAVPAERVINAMPFYTRVWKTLAGTLSTEAIGMQEALDLVAKNKAETYWDTNVCQNVASYESEGAEYQIWLEDDRSLAEKTGLAANYGLAGVASWKLGLEADSVWQVITENLFR